MHQKTRYGGSSEKYGGLFLAALLDLKPKTILDYGCGQSRLSRLLGELEAIQMHLYDPAIPELAQISTDTADLIINTDVMEHIPPEDVDDVLKHMASIGQNVLFIIAQSQGGDTFCLEQLKSTPLHCTLKTTQQWQAKISEHFPQAFLIAEIPKHVVVITTWEPAAPKLFTFLAQKHLPKKPKLRQRNKRKLKYWMHRLKTFLRPSSPQS